MTHYSTIISVTELQSQLYHPDWVVVDCRFNLLVPDAGRKAYLQEHIPGAVYAHLDYDLAGAPAPDSGRHPLPDSAALVQQLERWGISNTTQVVAYDDAGGSTAARLWWLLRWLGCERCAVLDGGLSAWQEAGFELVTEQTQVRRSVFKPQINDQLWVSTDDVVQNLQTHHNTLIDARAAVRFRGEKEPIDPVAGHVPQAVNLPLDGNLSEGRFLSPDALRQRFESVLQGQPAEQVIHMCGSGVTACHNKLAMEIAGLSGSRIYVGSWSEWIRDKKRPIATTA